MEGPSLSVSDLKAKSLEFVNLIGNKHDTSSSKIVCLLANDFAVQHAESSPSTGGRDAFLARLGERLKLARGHVSVEVRHVIAEVFENETRAGQCWVYSKKNTPFGSSMSVSLPQFCYEMR